MTTSRGVTGFAETIFEPILNPPDSLVENLVLVLLHVVLAGVFFGSIVGVGYIELSLYDGVTVAFWLAGGIAILLTAFAAFAELAYRRNRR